jgi:hypothetical protein
MSQVTEIIKSKDYGIEENKFNEMQKGLQLTLNERDLLRKEFEVVSKLELIKENTSKFRELRLKWAKNRTLGVNDWHKKGKAVSLAVGKLYDARKNELNREGEANEKVLLDAENHLENLEKEKIIQLSIDRKALIVQFEEVDSLKDLGLMSIEIWDNVLAGAKANFNARKAAKEKEKAEAEKQRIESLRLANIEKERQEAIKKENAKLKAEADAKDAEIEKNRLAQVAKDKSIALKAETERLERVKLENKRILAEKKIQDAKDAEIQKERLKQVAIQDKLKAQLKSKEEAEQKAKEREEARLQSELNKGDSEKVIDLIDSLKVIKRQFTFKSESNIIMFKDVRSLLDKVILFIEK